MVIICMIGTLSLPSFLIPIYNLADRSSINLTLLLTVVAFKLLLSDNLPKVSYFTFLDTYVLCAFAFIFFIAVANATFAFLTGIKDTASCAPENAEDPQDRDCEPPTEAYCEPYNYGLYRLPFLSTPACWMIFQSGGAWTMADAIAVERYGQGKRQDNAKQHKTKQDKTRQDKTRQDKTRRTPCKPCVTRQMTIQDKAHICVFVVAFGRYEG